MRCVLGAGARISIIARVIRAVAVSIALASGCSAAIAQRVVAPEWLVLGEDHAFRYFVDPASLRGDATRRTVQAVFSARAPEQRVQSMRVLLEADCVDPRTRVVSRTLHAEPMGEGMEIALPIARAASWDYARPGTGNEWVRRYACTADLVDRPGVAGKGAPVSPDAAQSSRAAPGAPIRVALERRGGTFTVPVLVNEQASLRFVVDSGAAHVSIPSDVVAGLIKRGAIDPADFTGRRTYVLADGSRITAETFRIRSMRIGDREIRDVIGTVGTLSSPFLLGQSFLGRLRSWSVDNTNAVLILE